MPAAAASKSEMAYDAIKARIIDGAYGPGHRLVLDRIAKDLSVSAVPVREAVRRLEAEGYVEYLRNVGPQVALIDAGAFVRTMEVLALLEGACTAAAAPHLTPADLARAADVNDRMAASLDDFDPVGFTALNREFHGILGAACPNTHLRGLVEREWARLDLIRRSAFSVVPGRSRGSIAEHARLLALITDGAPADRVETYAREHKLATLRAFRRRSGDPIPTEEGDHP
jgi:DNA-binding GntR family transcriptional regulator